MKFMVESIDNELEVITEAKENGEKSYSISGIFAMAEGVNKNKIADDKILKSKK